MYVCTRSYDAAKVSTQVKGADSDYLGECMLKVIVKGKCQHPLCFVPAEMACCYKLNIQQCWLHRFYFTQPDGQTLVLPVPLGEQVPFDCAKSPVRLRSAELTQVKDGSLLEPMVQKQLRTWKKRFSLCMLASALLPVSKIRQAVVTAACRL